MIVKLGCTAFVSTLLSVSHAAVCFSNCCEVRFKMNAVANPQLCLRCLKHASNLTPYRSLFFLCSWHKCVTSSIYAHKQTLPRYSFLKKGVDICQSGMLQLLGPSVGAM